MSQNTGVWKYAEENPFLTFIIIVVCLSVIGDVLQSAFHRNEQPQVILESK